MGQNKTEQPVQDISKDDDEYNIENKIQVEGLKREFGDDTRCNICKQRISHDHHSLLVFFRYSATGSSANAGIL